MHAGDRGGWPARVTVPISVDTYKAAVADAALAAGASIVNDISGLRYEPALGGVVARRGAALILMHTRGRSSEMYRAGRLSRRRGRGARRTAREHGVCDRRRRAARARARRSGPRFREGSPPQLRSAGRLDEFGELGRPLVVGASRKAISDAAARARGATARSRLGDGRRRRGRCARPARTSSACTPSREMVAGGAGGRRNSEVSSGRFLMDWLTELLQRPAVSWSDLLDIGLVSILIYELLLLIRGTRAAQMALSGGFIIGLYFLSRLAAARDRQLGDPQSGGLRGLRDHRAVPGGHPSRARAFRPGAVLPLFRARHRARTRRSRSWSWRRRRSPPGISARSS